MDFQQPKPDSKKYTDLIREIENGTIKIPKFQRDFVWSIDKTAGLLDSILKGYPIGTFILWQTDERLNNIKNIGNLDLPETPDGTKVQYVLDGQQRITSLFAAYKGVEVQKVGERKITDYRNIFVNLDPDLNPEEDAIITSEKSESTSVSLHDVLNFTYGRARQLREIESLSEDDLDIIDGYSQIFKSYDFSTILLRRDDVGSAIDVFTRINTGGQTLTLFEIMSAKTYDEAHSFDMQEKWQEFLEELKDAKYDEISSTIILFLLSLILSPTRECKKGTILSLDKAEIITNWNNAIDCLRSAIDYFRSTYRIPVSRLLPYDSLLVPFAYFFHQHGGNPEPRQAEMLQELFWRVSLSGRYSSATESKLAQDIKRVQLIIDGRKPTYDDIRVNLDDAQALIDTSFTASNAYSKAVLCLLAYHQPKDFQNDALVILDNSWLKQANSRNYHHFFPKAFLRNRKINNANSLMNIVFVSDHLNKRSIGSKAPSKYVGEFQKTNSGMASTLRSHLIEADGFGIAEDDYEMFLNARAEWVFAELNKRLNSDK